MDENNRKLMAWIARSFGRTEYLPLRESDLEALSAAGNVVEKYPGTHLFKEGEESRHAYIIERGQVELYRGTKESKRLVGRATSGSVLGDIAMFQGDPYISSARAVDAVTTFQFERDLLIPVLLQRPVITLRWLVAGLNQLESTQSRVLGLMHKTVREQVAELVLSEANVSGEVNLSQAGIADLIGASRQTVNEALSSLRDLGAIGTAYRAVIIHDRDVLERIAGHS